MHETPEYGSRRSAREEAERERMAHIYCTHYITRPRRRHQPSNFQFMSRPVRPSPETQTTRGSITQPRRRRTLSVETRRGWPVAVEWGGRRAAVREIIAAGVVEGEGWGGARRGACGRGRTA